MHRPLAVFTVTVEKAVKIDQVLHLGLLHMWAAGGGEEGFVRTNMFIRLGGADISISHKA